MKKNTNKAFSMLIFAVMAIFIMCFTTACVTTEQQDSNSSEIVSQESLQNSSEIISQQPAQGSSKPASQQAQTSSNSVSQQQAQSNSKPASQQQTQNSSKPASQQQAPSSSKPATQQQTSSKVTSVSSTSYQSILDTYSKKLRQATPKLLEEYKNEAAANTEGLTGLATICNNKITELAKINTDGTQEMASYMYKHGSGSYDEYQEWALKLYDVYEEEAQKITDAYMDSAMG